MAMVFFLGRLVRKRIANHSKTSEAIEREEADFHTRVISNGALDGMPGKEGKSATGRPVQSVNHIVDLTRSKTLEVVAKPEKKAVKPEVEGARPSQSATHTMAIENLPQKQKDIEKLIKEFFEAARITEMLPTVRDAQRVQPLMEDYYQRNPIKKQYWKGISKILPIEEPGYHFASVEVMFDNSLPLQVVVEETPAGFVLDWESTVQYSEMDWKEFLGSRPDKPKMFRVFASKPEGTPDEPADGAIAMLKIRHPHEEGTINARFDPKNSRFAPLIKQMKLNHWNDVPVTLRLYFPETNAVENEVQISGVIGKGWLKLSD